MQRKLALLLFFPCLLPLFGALSSTNTWEIRPTNGNDTNGGCFDPGVTSPGTDFSQQNSPQYTFTNLVIAATTTNVTSASHTFVAADVGNCVHISAGSGFTTGWYEILSVSTGIATLDRSAGTAASTGGTFFVGGALQTLPQIITILSTTNQNAVNQTTYVKAESVISTGAQIAFSSTTNQSTFIGYGTTRGDNGQVTVKANTANPTGASIFLLDGNRLYNWIANGNYSASNRAVAIGFHVNGSSTLLVNVLAENVTEQGISFSSNQNTCIACTATNAGSGGNPAITFSSNNGPNYCIFCVAYANPTIGFSGFGGVLSYCISANNTGTGSHGFVTGGGDGPTLIDHSLAYGNAGDGFHITAPGETVGQITNSIAYGNGTFGINAASVIPTGIYYFNNNAYGGNTSGNLNNVTAGASDVTLTGDPTVAGASNNFALNNTAGAGAACRSAGFPGVLQAGGTGFSDIGPLQHSSAGAGQKGFPIVQ